MDYDDNFETLDELLTTINAAVQDMADMNTTDTAGPYFSYMFDRDDDVFDDMDVISDDVDIGDMETGVFTLSPLH